MNSLLKFIITLVILLSVSTNYSGSGDSKEAAPDKEDTNVEPLPKPDITIQLKKPAKKPSKKQSFQPFKIFPLDKLPIPILSEIGKHFIKPVTETDQELVKRAKNELPHQFEVNYQKEKNALYIKGEGTHFYIPAEADPDKNLLFTGFGESAVSFDKSKLCFAANYREKQRFLPYVIEYSKTKLFAVNLKSKNHVSCSVPRRIRKCCISAQGDCIFSLERSTNQESEKFYFFNPLTKEYKSLLIEDNHGACKLVLNKQATKLVALCACDLNAIYEMKETRKPAEFNDLAHYMRIRGVCNNSLPTQTSLTKHKKNQ